MSGATDIRHMRRALGLARQGLGQTWPNPAVGCVIVKDGRIVGQGRTAPGGRPHAEAVALADAGEAARGADIFVTLEPCTHYGETPPCADTLIRAGIRRVVCAMPDPDPRVSGRGMAALRRAGVVVEEGLCAEAATALNEGFFLRLRAGRPMVTLKLAATLDGRIATATGKSQWITGPAARQRAHHLRATHDAVLAGIGTVLADDPLLTPRLPGREGRPPVRIVLDSRLRTPLDSALLRSASADAPVWVVCADTADDARHARLTARGVAVLPARTGADGRADVADALRQMAALGLTRVLAEGGGQLAGALLRADCADALAWFQAGLLGGGDGAPAVGPLELDDVAGMPRWTFERSVACGPDRLSFWRRRPPESALDSPRAP